MIEEVILGYLSKSLGVPVFMEEPAKPPQKCIIIDKLGSSEKNRLSSATLAVQSYGGSLYEAARLNHTVKAAMRDTVTLDDVISCKLNSGEQTLKRGRTTRPLVIKRRDNYGKHQ